jgi:hypothetical protein
MLFGKIKEDYKTVLSINKVLEKTILKRYLFHATKIEFCPCSLIKQEYLKR